MLHAFRFKQGNEVIMRMLREMQRVKIRVNEFYGDDLIPRFARDPVKFPLSL